jgi:two-component system, chemotaxis family, CheB/CheR fusion protein
MRVEVNHVYVIPPNTNLAIAQGVLKLQPRQQTRTLQRSIDFFLNLWPRTSASGPSV